MNSQNKQCMSSISFKRKITCQLADNENMVNSNQFMYIIKEFYSQRQNQVLQWQYIPSNYPSHIIVNPNNIIATFSVKVQDNYSDNKIPLYSNVPWAVCTVWIIIGIVWTCDFHVSHVSKIPSTWPYFTNNYSVITIIIYPSIFLS